MQTTITWRQLPGNWVALAIVLIGVAMMVGFAAGHAVSAQSAIVLAPSDIAHEPAQSAQIQTLPAGWAYRYDSTSKKWYAQHYAPASTGFAADGIYEMRSGPNGAVSGCGLDRNEPDC